MYNCAFNSDRPYGRRVKAALCPHSLVYRGSGAAQCVALHGGYCFNQLHRFDERGQNTRARPFLLQWQDGNQVTVFPQEAAVASLRGQMGTTSG